MKKQFVKFILLLLPLIFIFSCSKQKYNGYDKSESGVYYKYYKTSNDTAKVRLGDYVVVNMEYHLADTVLFDSKKIEDELSFQVVEPIFKGDIYEAIKMMSVGDSMSFVVVADSFFLKTTANQQLPDFVSAGEPMYYDVKLLERQTPEQHKNALEQMHIAARKKEMSTLLSYLRENKIDTPPLSSGLYLLEQKNGHGPLPDTGDILKVKLKVAELNGKQLYSNQKSSVPLQIEFGKPFDTRGFMQGLSMMRKGSKTKLLVPSPIGVGAYGMQGVEAYTTLEYEVELIEIIPYSTILKQRKVEENNYNKNQISEQELLKLDSYLKNNGIKQQKTLGIYFIENQKGSGKKAIHGSTVEVHYKLFDLQGNLLGTSHKNERPFMFVLGTGAVIKGWETGIKKMREGGMATIIIPSNMAYGAQGKGNIPPNTTLVFDLFLVSVE